jgi:hypothetical protein
METNITKEWGLSLLEGWFVLDIFLVCIISMYNNVAMCDRKLSMRLISERFFHYLFEMLSALKRYPKLTNIKKQQH